MRVLVGVRGARLRCLACCRILCQRKKGLSGAWERRRTWARIGRAGESEGKGGRAMVRTVRPKLVGQR